MNKYTDKVTNTENDKVLRDEILQCADETLFTEVWRVVGTVVVWYGVDSKNLSTI